MFFNDIADLYAANPALFAGSVFVLGLVVGSFLNVVIYRLPVMLDREWRDSGGRLVARRAPPARPRHPDGPPRPAAAPPPPSAST